MNRIARIEIGRRDYEVAGSFKFLKPGPDGIARRPSVIVRLTDEAGHTGVGQSVPIPTWTYETPETVLSTLERYLAPELLGADAADLDGIHARMNQAIRSAFSVGQPLCKAAIDLACHDLVARAQGRPAHALLGDPVAGGVRERLTLSWTVASPEEDVYGRQLEEGRARGYRHFNIKVGAPQSLAYDVQLAKRVRSFAPDSFLWADANTGYTEAEALIAARALADAGVDVLESPLPPNRISGYRALHKQGALPILMDEGLLSPVELGEFIELEMLDGIALKPARCAGLLPTKRLVELANARGLLILGSGLTDPDWALAAAAHAYAWAGLDHPCALNGPQFLRDATGGGALVVDGGTLVVPQGHGLGIAGEPVVASGWRVVA